MIINSRLIDEKLHRQFVWALYISIFTMEPSWSYARILCYSNVADDVIFAHIVVCIPL